ncbi:MAG: radical SAM protein [Euryarchaeota archaeon HGW-Euryarchaeota-1]|nr:MAG: radical SAM protein [Euryarchaeota archaeon HGW-Euryarchaeota-1]
MVRESPEYLRTSTAAAMTLGFIPGRFYRDAKLYCINLLLTYTGGCKANCAFCGLSRERKSEDEKESFIRVDWPIYKTDEIIKAMNKVPHARRVCISMITHPGAYEDLCNIVEKIKKTSDILISALITPALMDEEKYIHLKQIGVDNIGIAVDASTPEIFDNLRGKGVNGPHKWDKYWQDVKTAVSVFGKNKATIHLITGIGESEKDMAETVQKSVDLGADPHMFSFFPEKCSIMENHAQPPIGKYRRIQLARYLIQNGHSNIEKMKFDENKRITDFGTDNTKLNRIIESGEPFITSGCPDKNGYVACNRPYSNCTPMQAMKGELRNFPFHPNNEDIKIVKKQLNKYD